jgi:hypothetical protein
MLIAVIMDLLAVLRILLKKRQCRLKRIRMTVTHVCPREGNIQVTKTDAVIISAFLLSEHVLALQEGYSI